MSSYSTLIEAWGTDTLNNKKRHKKRRIPREHYKNYFIDEEDNEDKKDIRQRTRIFKNENENKNKNVQRSKNYRKKRISKQSHQHRDSSTNRFRSRPRTQQSNQNRDSDTYVEPIKIKFEEDSNKFDYDGYNSSDYEQYELDHEDEDQYKSRSSNKQVYQNDNSVMMDDCVYEQTAPQSENNYDSIDNHLDSNTIHRLYTILDKLENDNVGGENIYDVLLFIFFGVFILFIIDYMYKIGAKTSLNL